MADVPDARAQAFGRMVQGLRDRRGMTQDDLAARTGLHRVTVSKIERGLTAVRPKTVRVLADALGVEALDPEVVTGWSVESSGLGDEAGLPVEVRTWFDALTLQVGRCRRPVEPRMLQADLIMLEAAVEQFADAVAGTGAAGLSTFNEATSPLKRIRNKVAHGLVDIAVDSEDSDTIHAGDAAFSLTAVVDAATALVHGVGQRSSDEVSLQCAGGDHAQCRGHFLH